MSEEAELQARIAALAGRINQQKQSAATGTGSSSVPAPASTGGYSPGYHASYRPASNRWTPYTQHQPSNFRGGGYQRPSYPAHRNKTLVVSNTAGQTSNSADQPAAASPDSPGWVSKRDRGHMQLINTSVYDQKMHQKHLDMEETAKEKLRRRNELEKNKIIKHAHGSSSSASSTVAAATDAPRDLVINDLRFRIAADGSKLIRIFDGSNKDAQTTPKQAKVAGVTFHRSKNGNLYRSGLIKKNLRYWHLPLANIPQDPILTPWHSKPKTAKSSKLCPKFTSTGTQISAQKQACRRTTASHEIDPLLESVGRPHGQSLTYDTGVCPYGPRCRFTHDMDKIAVCQQLMRHGNCAAGEECNLSHDLTPERVPWCIHFIRGNCTNEDCRYLHVRPSASAPVCSPFATMGYCDKGVECDGRHVNECPDYANKGVCRNTECRLPHVDSVANKRRAEANKAATRQGTAGGDNDSSDLSSDEEDYQEIDSDDVDSEDMDEEDVIMSGAGEQSHELTQQQDFVAFS